VDGGWTKAKTHAALKVTPADFNNLLADVEDHLATIYDDFAYAATPTGPPSEARRSAANSS
jgi:hypothetical protein